MVILTLCNEPDTDDVFLEEENISIPWTILIIIEVFYRPGTKITIPAKTNQTKQKKQKHKKPTPTNPLP